MAGRVRIGSWEPGTPGPGGGYRESATLLDDDDNVVGELDARLGLDAGGGLRGDAGWDVSEDELRMALRAYAADELQRRVAAGHDFDAERVVELDVGDAETDAVRTHLVAPDEY